MGFACGPQWKIHLMWIPRKNWTAEMESPWWTRVPSFMNNKSLVAIRWQGLLPTLLPEEPQTEPSASSTMPCFSMLSQATTAGKPWFHLPTNWLRPAPPNHNCTIWIPHLYKTDLIENLSRNICYTRQPFVFMENNSGSYPNLCLLGSISLCSNKCLLFFITI